MGKKPQKIENLENVKILTRATFLDIMIIILLLFQKIVNTKFQIKLLKDCGKFVQRELF